MEKNKKNISDSFGIEQNEKNLEEKVPVPDLENQKFEFTNEEIENKIRVTVQKMSNGILTAKEEDEMIKDILPEMLEYRSEMEIIDEQIKERTREAIDKKIDEKNRTNGKTKKEREEIENEIDKENIEEIEDERREDELEDEEKIIIDNEQDGQEQDIPEDVINACEKLGVTKIKGYYYANAKQLGDKVDNIPVNENGGKVLILETENSSNPTGPDRYFGFQDEKMVLYGTQDKEVEEIIPGKPGSVPPVNGKLIEPLKKDNPTYVEFSDSEGLYVQEKLEENMNVSIQDLENYKKEVEELLEKYAQNIVEIQENKLLSPEQKIIMLEQNNNRFNDLNSEIATEYGVSQSDVKSIKLEAIEYTEKEQQDEMEEQKTEQIEEEEIEAFEVPGKRRRE